MTYIIFDGNFWARLAGCNLFLVGPSASDGKGPMRKTAVLEKAPSRGFSARGVFIKDCAESVAVVAKSPAVLFGK